MSLFAEVNDAFEAGRKKPGIISVRLDHDTYAGLIARKHQAERDAGRVLTFSEVIIALLRVQLRSEGMLAGASPLAPCVKSIDVPIQDHAEQPCLSCMNTPAGTETKCMFCGRGLSLEAAFNDGLADAALDAVAAAGQVAQSGKRKAKRKGR